MWGHGLLTLFIRANLLPRKTKPVLKRCICNPIFTFIMWCIYERKNKTKILSNKTKSFHIEDYKLYILLKKIKGTLKQHLKSKNKKKYLIRLVHSFRSMMCYFSVPFIFVCIYIYVCVCVCVCLFRNFVFISNQFIFFLFAIINTPHKEFPFYFLTLCLAKE